FVNLQGWANPQSIFHKVDVEERNARFLRVRHRKPVQALRRGEIIRSIKTPVELTHTTGLR
ncbi:MAG: hypothetical protein JSV16_05075, partial [Candidatus Hydrogenedentota bacterium]